MAEGLLWAAQDFGFASQGVGVSPLFAGLLVLVGLFTSLSATGAALAIAFRTLSRPHPYRISFVLHGPEATALIEPASSAEVEIRSGKSVSCLKCASNIVLHRRNPTRIEYIGCSPAGQSLLRCIEQPGSLSVRELDAKFTTENQNRGREHVQACKAAGRLGLDDSVES